MEKNQETIIENAKKYIRKLSENDFGGHDFYHSVRVCNLSARIAEQENADIFTVSLAALLHDADDEKLSPETYKNKQNAVDFMKSQMLSDAQIKNICDIIEDISFLGVDTKVPGTIEGKCVQDGDRLDALGAIGAARAFAYGGSRSRIMYDPEIKPQLNMTKQQYRSHVSTTLNHFYEKLFLLKDMMNTETGKKIAEKRDAFLHEFTDEFLNEWEGLS